MLGHCQNTVFLKRSHNGLSESGYLLDIFPKGSSYKMFIRFTPLYIQQSFAWGIFGLAILYLAHWASDLGWLTGLSWLTGSGRQLVSPRVYRWIMLVCGAALVIFGITFVYAGIRFLVTGEVSLD